MSADRTATLDRIAFVALAAALGLIQFSIYAWVPLVVAGVCWLWMVKDGNGWPKVPPFFWPLVALAAWTLVSSAFSSEPGASFLRSRQLLFYLTVPLVVRVARGKRAMQVVDVIIALGAVGALAGIVEYAFLGYHGLGNRPKGTLGHYMTYSGVIMLVLCAAVSRLVFRGREWLWPAVAVPALIVALVASESRNAWIGALVAISVMLVLKNWKLLFAVPVVIGVLAVLAPEVARDRARSIFDPTDPTNRDRVAMLKSGKAMIADHPLVGVGPNMVPKEYLAKYKTPDAVDPSDKPGDTRSHLHNVPVQLAAERGLPAHGRVVVVHGRRRPRSLQAGATIGRAGPAHGRPGRGDRPLRCRSLRAQLRRFRSALPVPRPDQPAVRGGERLAGRRSGLRGPGTRRRWTAADEPRRRL